MSETDDTDLLLLIPPDFFLVHSPDLGFDSDGEIDNSVVKDSIVSDLITQVNDLESRICMIENSEKSATLCSSFNDDSYFNNSLTESDILRYKENENNVLTNSLPKISHNYNVSLSQLMDKSENGNIKINETTINSDTDHAVKTDLLTEIDSFLRIRNDNTITKYFIDSTKPKEIASQDLTENNQPLEYKTGTQIKSLALPAVHNLLKEMEDTQREIERKLMLRNSQICSQEVLSDKRSRIESDKPPTLGLDDPSTNCLRTLSRKQADDLINRKHTYLKDPKSDINHSANNSDSQLCYFPVTEVIEKNQRFIDNHFQMKPVSPNRSKVDNSLCEIDSLTNEKTTVVQLSSDKSPSKSRNFRRYLNFEGMSLSPKTSKLRPLLHSDSTTKGRFTPNSYHTSETNEKSPYEPFNKSNIDITNITEKKPTYSSPVRTNADRIHSMLNPLQQKTSNDAILQQKISSNNLLSLSELWNNEPTFYSDDPNKLRQKLEEEKYRRQHCEQQIQALQLRVLEEREKLAVAVKVDQEKDKAILQITESWKKLNDHWREIEEQRHSLAQQLQVEKESSKLKNEDLMKKVEKWEKEVSQALDLALGYKEKSDCTQLQMNALKNETEDKLKAVDSKINELTEENEMLINENQKQLQQLNSFHDRINEEEKLLSKLKVELEKSKKQINDYEAEVNVLKEQKETLAIKLQEEKNRISVLEKLKKELEGALAESVKREKTALEAARLSNERIDVTRTELKALYQGQLETVVKEKLQEFQSQLDAAETALTEELNSKEKQWIERSNNQHKQLQEKYTIDLCKIEESYRKEIDKWKKKLIESEKLRRLSDNHLQEEKNKRVEIAQKLHSVMENQWREALNIISNPTQNMHDSLKDENKDRWPSNHESADRMKCVDDLKASRSNSGTSLIQGDDAPFCREGIVTSRMLKNSQDLQLKKYIEMIAPTSMEREEGNELGCDDAPTSMEREEANELGCDDAPHLFPLARLSATTLLERGSQQESMPDIDHTFSTEASFMNTKWMLDNGRPSGDKPERNQTYKPPWK